MGIAIGLIGTGIQWRWPEQKGLGTWLIVIGCSVLVIAAVAAIVRSLTIREYERQHPPLPSALPTQQLAQNAPINNAPVFAPIFAPSFNQSQAVEQSIPDERETVQAEVECTDCYFVAGVLSQSNMLDRGNGKRCMVAQADFHLKPIPDSVPWIELRTQFVFYAGNNRLRRVADGVWREQGNVIQMPINTGDTRRLVIALEFNDVGLSTYEYAEEPTHRPRFTTTGIFHSVLAPKMTELGVYAWFTVQVRLIGKYLDRVTLDQEFWFSLSGLSLEITKIAPPQVSEGGDS